MQPTHVGKLRTGTRSAQTREKRHFRGKAADPGSRFPGQGCLGRREQPAHEPLIRRAMVAEVPLTGYHSGFRAWARGM